MDWYSSKERFVKSSQYRRMQTAYRFANNRRNALAKKLGITDEVLLEYVWALAVLHNLFEISSIPEDYLEHLELTKVRAKIEKGRAYAKAGHELPDSVKRTYYFEFPDYEFPDYRPSDG